MDWVTLLKSEADAAYRAVEGLMTLVADQDLDWKPETGENWMSMGQLLDHIAEACGKSCRGFATGDWGVPEDLDFENMAPGEMLPPAEAMPAVESVSEARRKLAKDKEVAHDVFREAEGRMDEMIQAPWDPRPAPLGRQLLGMVNHLNNHKAQLFYYLKLQGKPVNTMHLYGMA